MISSFAVRVNSRKAIPPSENHFLNIRLLNIRLIYPNQELHRPLQCQKPNEPDSAFPIQSKSIAIPWRSFVREE